MVQSAGEELSKQGDNVCKGPEVGGSPQNVSETVGGDGGLGPRDEDRAEALEEGTRWGMPHQFRGPTPGSWGG